MILSVPSQLMVLFVGIIGIQVPVSSGFIAPPSGPAFSSIARPPHLSRYFSKRDGHDDLMQHCEDSVRNVVTGLLFSAVLLLSPPDNTCNSGSPSHIDWFVARADENQVTVDGTSKTEESLLTAPAQAPSEKQGVTVVDEVWSLVDKYFIDQSFNGQDWKDVKRKYAELEGPNPSDDKSMQVVTKMTKSLGDKYTRILDAGAYEAIQKYDLIGVGATLMPNAQKELIVGAPPVSGSVADKAGMKPGDYVVAVNSVSTKGRSAFDIIDQISENPTAKSVTMTVRTQGPNDLAGEGFTRDLVLDRKFADVRNPIEYRISETRKDGTKVAYVRVAEFNSIVKAKLEEAVTDLEKQGASAYVLDLRGNPGGAFQSAVEISSLFLDNRVATYVVDSNQVELPFKTASGRVVVDNLDPMVIWVDKHSASASEVLAGSLHDNCRAVIAGENSFGKGKVQAVYGLKNGAGLVLTVAKYITPSGTDIQGSGITPDIETKLPPALVPVISGDTSKVDFADISKRLSMCQVPTTHL